MCVDVKIHKSEDETYVIVKDNGKCAEKEKYEEMKNKLSSELTGKVRWFYRVGSCTYEYVNGRFVRVPTVYIEGEFREGENF